MIRTSFNGIFTSKHKSLLSTQNLVKRNYQKLDDQLILTNGCRNAIEKKLVPNGKFLRISIQGGEGCGGFTYKFLAEKLETIGKDDLYGFFK